MPDDAGLIGPEATYALPSSPEAEAALLGALLARNETFHAVAAIVTADDFADAAHARIFAAIAKLVIGGHIANPITLHSYFAQDRALDDVGGAAYLADLAGSVITASGAADYAGIIADMAVRRRLIDFYAGGLDRARTFDIDLQADSLIADATRDLGAISLRSTPEETIDAAKGIDAALAASESAGKNEGLVGLSTGFHAIDDLTHGLAPKQLTILAARPNMGKSALAAGIAMHVARKGDPVGIVSLEMTREAQWQRILSHETGIALSRIVKGRLESWEWERLTDMRERLRNVPLMLTDRRGMTIDRIAGMGRVWKRERGLKLLIVDHMHKIAVERSWSRREDLTAISNGLANLAGEIDIPVLALAQLSRGVESRDDKRPTLSDLRESGAIEEDADIVMFLYREDYYLDRGKPEMSDRETQEKFQERLQRWHDRKEAVSGDAEAIIGKNRHGPTGSAKLTFIAERAEFHGRAEDAQTGMDLGGAAS